MALALAAAPGCVGTLVKHWRVPVEVQSLRNECGLACLAMVVGYYDRRTTLWALRRRFAGLCVGVTLKDLAEFAQELGYLARGLRAEPEHLGKLKLPAILHWNLDHFVVLVRVARNRCVIHDPARGRIQCSWNEVEDRFTGVVLELWPLADGETQARQERSAPAADLSAMPRLSLSQVWQWAMGARSQLVWTVVLSLLLQIMVLAAPWHVQWTVDEALVSGDEHLIGVLCVGFALLLMCRVLTHLLRGLMVVHLGHLLSFQLACRLLMQLLHLPLSWFEGRHVGDVASRLASLQPLREWLTQGAAAMVVDGLMVILSLVLMLVYHPALAVLVGGIHGLYLLVQMSLVPRFRRFAMAAVVAQAAEQSHLLQSVQTMHNVKTYTLEALRLAQWQRLHSHTLQQSLSLQRQQLGLGTGALLVGGTELILLIYCIAHEVLQGAFSLGMLFAFLSYRAHFTERLGGLAEQLVSFRALQVHLQRVGEVWAEPAEVRAPERAGADLSNGALQRLCLQGVSYRHHPRQAKLIDHVDLNIEVGEFVALVGPSGCGKSTLLKLMMGLLTPTEGAVLWRERVLLGEDVQAFRRVSACVLQGDGFFSGSLLENIALFDVPDLVRVRHCLQEVDMAHAVATLPMGLHTQVGDIGQNLSSGQLQRLLMARALYRQPQFLFLDEATANLDAASAATIQTLVRNLSCTRLVVTHDLNFAACADRAFELNDGRLCPLPRIPRNAVAQSPD